MTAKSNAVIVRFIKTIVKYTLQIHLRCKAYLTKSGFRVFGFCPAGSTSKVDLTFHLGVLTCEKSGLSFRDTMGAMRKCLSGLLCFLSLSNQMLAECRGDLDGSGTVKVADELGWLSMFGCAEDCGESDLDGDDAGGVSDTLLVLGSFGQSCDDNAPSVWADSTFGVLFEDNVVYGSGMSHDGWGGPVLDTIALELDVYAPDNQEEGRPALLVLDEVDREDYLCLSLRVAKVPLSVSTWVSDVANGNPQYIEICAGLIDNPVSADHQSSFW